MPMVRVERDYAFEGPDGRRSLPELFDGRSQLILYRFFFEEGVDGWPDAGCVGCSSFADGIPELGLLHSRDITFAMASPAPQANLQRYAERMGWTDVPWYTICTERFSADFGVDEWFGLNVFLRDGKDVYRTYFLQHGAMVQWIGSLWSLWSLTPYGGQGDDEELPEGWPRAPQSFWFRRHDEFDEPPPSARLGIDADDRPSDIPGSASAPSDTEPGGGASGVLQSALALVGGRHLRSRRFRAIHRLPSSDRGLLSSKRRRYDRRPLIEEDRCLDQVRNSMPKGYAITSATASRGCRSRSASPHRACSDRPRGPPDVGRNCGGHLHPARDTDAPERVLRPAARPERPVWRATPGHGGQSRTSRSSRSRRSGSAMMSSARRSFGFGL